jgi:uncharacterized protein (TIGR01319 family)
VTAALLIDFGSTYTKLRAIDLAGRRVLGSGQGPSTVTTDVSVGLRAALADLEARLGALPSFKYRLASSSAAGGLRMVTVGLVKELTVEAARQAALGAGARLVGTFAHQLTRADVRRVVELAPDILLLAGGTDGGNSEVILHNARALGESAVACPIIYAGNRVAADDASDMLTAKTLHVTENVMPEFNVLNIEPARAVIRQIFIERIVHAKGIDRAQSMFDRVLMPTPVAVLEGARLIADGCGTRSGLGDLLVVDPGGATTDVHSIASGDPATPAVVMRGLPEPRVKRSVEGDLGMRHNAAAIVELAGLDAIARASGLASERVTATIASLASDVGRLPATEEEAKLDEALARAAIGLAVARHCGTVQTVYTVSGPALVQHGKDLSRIANVIGTGGVLAHGHNPEAALRMALADPAEPSSLRPTAPRLWLDRDYILYACGLLAEVEPEAALELALTHLQAVQNK